MTTKTTKTKLDRLERLLDLRDRLVSLRLHRAGNPYHDEKGRFTSGGSSRKELTADQKKRVDDFRKYAKAEQAEQHADHRAARKELIRDQKAEHNALRREQAAEKKALPKEHARELKELDREHAKDRRDQEKDHAKELKSAAKDDPESVPELHGTHASDKADMITSQRQEREHYVSSHAEALAEQKLLHKQARDDQRQEFKEARKDLKNLHDEEKKEIRDRLHDELKELKAELHDELKGERSISRANPDRFKPGRTLKANSAEAILKTCLRRKGWSKAFRENRLTGEQHLELLEEVRRYGQSWLHHEAAAFLAANDADTDETTVRTLTGTIGQHAKRLFGRMKQFVRELYVAGAMTLLGPRALTEKELSAIDHQAHVQAQYFDRFERQTGKQPTIPGPDGKPIIVGPKPEQPLDGTFPSRAEQYGASVWGAAQEVARATATDYFTIERRAHIGRDQPCDGCVEELDLDWQPIGTLKPIGDCECLINCHCHFQYRTGEDSMRIYYAGETPDNAADFGTQVIDV